MRSLVAFIAMALAALAGTDERATAQGAVKSVHNDWQVRCDTPPGAQNEQCALMQSVMAEDRPNVGLTVIVLKTADQKSRLMRVVAPMGVLLPSGLGLKIDQVDIGRAGFVRCLPNGCVAEVVMDDNLLKQLRAGQTATFVIFQTPEEGIGYGQRNPACLYRVPEIVTRGRFPARRVVTVLMDWWLGPAAPRTLRRKCVGLSVAGPSRGDSLTARPGRASPSLGQRKREVNIGEGALGASCPPEMVIQSHLDATGGLAMPTTIRDCYRRSRPDRRWGAGYLPLAQRRNV
jgi:invasion protein IalB